MKMPFDKLRANGFMVRVGWQAMQVSGHSTFELKTIDE